MHSEVLRMHLTVVLRFANTDFAIASVMSNLMNEGASTIGVFYDIFCHWSKTFWSNRAP